MSKPSLDIAAYLNHVKNLTEALAMRTFSGDTLLDQSMAYSFFAGGKRIRPAIAFAASEAVCGSGEPSLPFGLAIEMIHTYSLIHDDLPAMDDDDLRRGLPTNHVKFGEAVAILAGDGLLTDAFTLLSSPETFKCMPTPTLLRCIREISLAAGSKGMVGGQAIDVLSEGKILDLQALEAMHLKKTGALIRASAITGGLSAGAGEDDIKALEVYSKCLGLAFQISDDILDIESTTEVLGKPVGSDSEREAATYPSLMGMQNAKTRLAELTTLALESVERFGDKGAALSALAIFVAERKN